MGNRIFFSTNCGGPHPSVSLPQRLPVTSQDHYIYQRRYYTPQQSEALPLRSHSVSREASFFLYPFISSFSYVTLWLPTCHAERWTLSGAVSLFPRSATCVRTGYVEAAASAVGCER